MSSATAAAPQMDAVRSPLYALRRRLTLLLIGAAVLPMTIVSLGGWVVFRGLIADRVAEHLQTVVHDHASAIDLFLEERLRALRLISESYSQDQLADPAVFRRVFAGLKSTHEQDFQDLSLIDDQGRHLRTSAPMTSSSKTIVTPSGSDMSGTKGDISAMFFSAFAKSRTSSLRFGMIKVTAGSGCSAPPSTQRSLTSLFRAA